MQPYFFPYIGHFSLIVSVDRWIVFDVTQYTPKTWINRNRILHPHEGWQYITIPLSNSSNSIKISEAKVLNLASSRKTICGKFSHYKKKAPFYKNIIELVSQVFEMSSNDSLVQLNVNGLRLVCEYLDIPFYAQTCTELNLSFPDEIGPGDWAPYICEQLDAKEYVNPANGSNLFDSYQFKKRGISLYFAEVAEFKYVTSPFQFIPSLSILDVLMWNSPDIIRDFLNKGTRLIAAE